MHKSNILLGLRNLRQKKTLNFLQMAGLAIGLAGFALIAQFVFYESSFDRSNPNRERLCASVAGISSLLVRDFVKLVILSIVIASPVAYFFMQNWLSDFAYRIEMEWWMFVGAGVLVIAVACLTVGFQSVRAALADPVKSLRSE